MREHRGLSMAIAMASVAFLATLPFTIPSTIWFVLFVYALVKAIGSAPEDADATAVLLAIVAIVTFFTLAIAVTISLLGRSMTPKKRKDRELQAERPGP